MNRAFGAKARFWIECGRQQAELAVLKPDNRGPGNASNHITPVRLQLSPGTQLHEASPP